MMDITINKGTTDVIISIQYLIELLQFNVEALSLYKAEGINVTSNLTFINNRIIYLQDYLLSIYKDDEEE